jgi:hypothetical protein
MISWKAVAGGLACQLVVQAALFLGIPLFGPEVLLMWTAVITWSLGPLLGGIASGLLETGKAWVTGLVAATSGTAIFVVATMFSGELWIVVTAVVLGGVIGIAGALVGQVARRRMG